MNTNRKHSSSTKTIEESTDTKNRAQQEIAIIGSLDIVRVPAGFPVAFCLLTQGDRQYVACYDAQRNMTVASRMLDSAKWQHKVLSAKVGWDSHNYITMTADDGGYLHLSGNMHCVPLIYFRTSKPWDITTFEQIEAMTSENEEHCTYPQFMRDAQDRLIFHYRDGSSGNGNEIYNVYDLQSKTWTRLLNKPLTDGLDRMNAYMSGPSAGPDGWFHLCWVWRDTPDCQTNHDPSYARSRDLIQWETIGGQPIELPITINTSGTLIDPVPVKGGILNGSLSIGFDNANNPVASYFKFDEHGKTQVYAAIPANGTWVTRQITNWDYRWDFAGRGSIITEIALGAIRPHGEGRLALPYSHAEYGRGLLIIDEATIELLDTTPEPLRYPPELLKLESDAADMQIRWAEDMGQTDDISVRYVLRWETLPHNRDHARKGPVPEPGMLRLHKLSSLPPYQ